jgi:hypothetical protein
MGCSARAASAHAAGYSVALPVRPLVPVRQNTWEFIDQRQVEPTFARMRAAAHLQR